ncbi:MAG TPA: 30S ribosomal protein S4 [bacterium]
MSRYTGPVCRYCRREGTKLFLKGRRCFSAKCAMEEGRNPHPPGGQKFGRRRTTSDYNTQLREKQKAKRIYCLTEKQFKNYYKQAAKRKGVTGDVLIEHLERRLDNAVYRMGFAVSRSQARQLVNHGHFMVNGSNVDIPSYQLRDGDVIQVKQQKRKSAPFQEVVNLNPEDCTYPWIEMDYSKLTGTYKHAPQKGQFDHQIQASLIVEFYSR